MSETIEPLEAVIITGPRKGEIIHLPEEAIPAVSDEEIRLLNKGMDLMEAALDRLETELRQTIEAVQGYSKRNEESAGRRERQAHAEASRDAGRRRFQADLARFEAEVERAKLRLARRPCQEEPDALPEGGYTKP